MILYTTGKKESEEGVIKIIDMQKARYVRARSSYSYKTKGDGNRASVVAVYRQDKIYVYFDGTNGDGDEYTRNSDREEFAYYGSDKVHENDTTDEVKKRIDETMDDVFRTITDGLAVAMSKPGVIIKGDTLLDCCQKIVDIWGEGL